MCTIMYCVLDSLTEVGIGLKFRNIIWKNKITGPSLIKTMFKKHHHLFEFHSRYVLNNSIKNYKVMIISYSECVHGIFDI